MSLTHQSLASGATIGFENNPLDKTSGKHNCGLNIIVDSFLRGIINVGINTVGFQIETASSPPNSNLFNLAGCTGAGARACP